MGGKCHCRNQNTGISSQSFSISYVYSGVIVMTAAYRITKFCIVVLALAPFFGFAETSLTKDDFYNLPLDKLGKVEITSATGNSTPLDRAPATATVITAHDIQAMGATNLDEVLETVPGLHVSLSSLSRLDSVYSIRGIHTGFNPHVLLLMNGVKVQFSVQGGRPVLFRYPVNNIARIEVIRGPGSAIYGADAYAGIVNIITKDISHGLGSNIGGRYGSFNSVAAWIQGSVERNGWGASYSFDYLASDGDSGRKVNSDFQSGFDAVFGTEASLAPGALSSRYEVYNSHLSLVNQDWQTNLWTWHARDLGVGAGGAQALDFTGANENDLYLVDVAYQSGDRFESVDARVRASYMYYDTEVEFNLFPPGTVAPIGTDGNIGSSPHAGLVRFPEGIIGSPGGITQDAEIEIITLYTGFDRQRWRVSIGARSQRLNSRERKNFGPGVIDGTEPVIGGELTDVSETPFVFVPDVSRKTRYVSVQNEWAFTEDWNLTVGVRHDEYSDFGSTTNPRAALVWAINEPITVKFLYGKAFRAPSFSEQFFENNPVALGDENLDPERISTYEFAFLFSPNSDVHSSINLFRYFAKDMIEFVPDSDAPTNTARNARDQNGKGVEWELNYDVGRKVRLKTSYSWNKSTDVETGEVVPDAPKSQWTVNPIWKISSSWSMGVLLNRVESRHRASEDTRGKIPDYTLIDSALNYEGRSFVASFKVKNLIDAEAKEPSRGEIPDDYPLPGRSLWLELGYKF